MNFDRTNFWLLPVLAFRCLISSVKVPTDAHTNDSNFYSYRSSSSYNFLKLSTKQEELYINKMQIEKGKKRKRNKKANLINI